MLITKCAIKLLRKIKSGKYKHGPDKWTDAFRFLLNNELVGISRDAYGSPDYEKTWISELGAAQLERISSEFIDKWITRGIAIAALIISIVSIILQV